MLADFFTWAIGITQGLGYWGILILMAVESSFIPFPSEVVIPPAAYLASQGKMDILLIIAVGTVGSILGALFNYFVALYFGRPVIYELAGHRYAKYFLISRASVEKAEKFFYDNSSSATLIGRLVPVIRQLISLPAGFCRMPFWRFLFLTSIGSALWISILAGLGYFVGANQALLSRYYQEISWALLGLGLLYLIWELIKFKKRRN